VDAFARGFGATHGLHAHDVRALVLLIDAARTGTPMGPGALGAQLGLSSASTTALLDRLEHAGHVSRRPHPGDRRKVIVEPTTHALDEGRRWFGAMNLDMLAVLERFDDAEVAVLLRVLEGLTATVQEHLDARPEPPPDAPDRR
jgi:DNA-binding MarR family transcriptional regulator